MSWLRTPPKSRRVAWFITVTVLTAPVVVGVHFFTRLMRGDYRWDADSIGIPVGLFCLFIFPITLCLLTRGLRGYRADVLPYAWGRGRFLRSFLWTFVTIYPVGLMSFAMVIDGIEGRLYWVAAFFLLHGYCMLILRASIVSRDVPTGSALPTGGVL